MDNTRAVVSIDDDSETPVTGVVCGWQDDETCLVLWEGNRYAVPVFADELMPLRRHRRSIEVTAIDTYVSTTLGRNELS